MPHPIYTNRWSAPYLDVLLEGAFERTFLVFFEFTELLLLLFLLTEGDLLLFLFLEVLEDPTLSAGGIIHHMSSTFNRPAILLVHKKMKTLQCMSNYTTFVDSLHPTSQSILGGTIFCSIFSIFSIILLGDMHYQIRRVAKVLEDEGRYIN